MPRDPRAFLWDGLEATKNIEAFIRGKSFDEFSTNVLLRSAVERQLEVLGEALGQLAKFAPDLAGQVPDLRRIVGLRNVLIHGYAVVNHDLVWRAVQEHLPPLRKVLRALAGPPGTDRV
jgi:uncharacterized protein with HEPN domain